MARWGRIDRALGFEQPGAADFELGNVDAALSRATRWLLPRIADPSAAI